MNRWSLALYDAGDLVTPVAEPVLNTQPRFEDEWNEVGSGSVTVQMSDADAGLIDVDQIVVFSLDGTARFAIIVEEIDFATVAGSAGEQTLTINGRGVLALIEDAVVEPATGTGHLPLEEVRQSNWTAFDFDDSGPEWVPSTEYATVTETTIFWDPVDWPDYGEPDGTSVPKYIGPSSGTQADAPAGDCYFRRGISTTAAVFDLFMAADNYAEAYLDGVLILTSPGFGITRHIEGGIEVSAGDHVLAVRVNNFFDDGSPGGNPMMLLYSAVTLTPDGLIGDVLTFSGSLTKICEYPDAAPGSNPGAELKKHIDAAQAAVPPRLVGVTYDFDELVDSNGLSW